MHETASPAIVTRYQNEHSDNDDGDDDEDDGTYDDGGDNTSGQCSGCRVLAVRARAACLNKLSNFYMLWLNSIL